MSAKDPTTPVSYLDVHSWRMPWSAELAGAAGRDNMVVTAATMASSGPGKDLVPVSRTYADGTVRTYTYLADGFTVDEVTITPPAAAAKTWKAQYNSEDVRTHWVLQ